MYLKKEQELRLDFWVSGRYIFGTVKITVIIDKIS